MVPDEDLESLMFRAPRERINLSFTRSRRKSGDGTNLAWTGYNCGRSKTSCSRRRLALNNLLRRLTCLRILIVAGWVVIIPPITSATQGFYVGPDGRPASVGLTDPLPNWTVYGHYQSGAECDKVRAQLEQRSFHMDPNNASAVAWSFAKCLADDSRLLRPNQGPVEQLSR
jgi:hypothetical protein